MQLDLSASIYCRKWHRDNSSLEWIPLFLIVHMFLDFVVSTFMKCLQYERPFLSEVARGKFKMYRYFSIDMFLKGLHGVIM